LLRIAFAAQNERPQAVIACADNSTYSERRGDATMSTHDQTMPAGAWNVPIPPKSSMTEEEFVTWCFKDEVRAEWIDGEVIIMSPVSTEHARLVNWLLQVVSIFVEQRELGTVLGPELFVRFAPKKRRYLPDLFFVAAPRTDLFRKAHFEGAPDMIMEVVSPDSVARDWRDKYVAYESAGVREYWVIDPMSERAEAYALSDAGKYRGIAERDGWLASIAVVGLRLKTEWFWPATRPKTLDALRELDVSAA
jgi:Uma2 family endonuclease